MLGVWFTALVKDSRHAWSLVYCLSEGRIQGMLGVWFTALVKEGFKACLESGLLP